MCHGLYLVSPTITLGWSRLLLSISFTVSEGRMRLVAIAEEVPLPYE